MGFDAFPPELHRRGGWPSGRYSGPRGQAAHPGATRGLRRGVKMGKAGLRSGANDRELFQRVDNLATHG